MVGSVTNLGPRAKIPKIGIIIVTNIPITKAFDVADLMFF